MLLHKLFYIHINILYECESNPLNWLINVLVYVTDRNKLEEYAVDANVNTANSLMIKTQWEDRVSIRF